MTKREQAMALFKEGYNCAQAVAGAFAEELGMPLETVVMLASSFGAGMGRLREVCGAVSGMALVAGAMQGYSDPKAGAEKAAHYALVQRLAGVFSEQNGSIVCHELLGLKAGKDDPAPEDRTSAYYQKRPCAELVGDAAEILAENLL